MSAQDEYLDELIQKQGETIERLKAEHTRAILCYTLKGYQAGENTDSKHWRQRAEAAEAQLAALRVALEPVARHEHDRAVAANALFSVEHWKHNAGQEWPHEPDDDSFTLFENCKHPLCAAVRPAVTPEVAPARIGAFDYTENVDGTITRKDWRQP